MAFKLEDVLKGENLLTTGAIGIGVYILAPLAGQILRPLAKTVIKGGVMAYDWTASTATEAMQGVRDTVNEAASEPRDEGEAHSKERVAEGMSAAGKRHGPEPKPTTP